MVVADTVVHFDVNYVIFVSLSKQYLFKHRLNINISCEPRSNIRRR